MSAALARRLWRCCAPASNAAAALLAAGYAWALQSRPALAALLSASGFLLRGGTLRADPGAAFAAARAHRAQLRAGLRMALAPCAVLLAAPQCSAAGASALGTAAGAAALGALLLGTALALALVRARRAWARAAALLAQGERQLELALAHVSDAVIGIDELERVTHMNPAAERLTGFSAEQATGMPVAQVAPLVHGSTRVSLHSAAARALGSVQHAWLLARDGSERSVALHCAELRDAAGVLHGALLVLCDQTEQQRAAAAVRESEARKVAVMEAALDAIVLMDHQGVITEWNAAAQRTTGHSREEVLGKTLAEVLVPPALRAAHRAGLARYLQTGVARVLGTRIEVPALRKDGSEFPAEVAIARIDAPGPPLFTGYIRDITERRQAAEAELLRKAKQAAEQANAELEAFSYSIAHDLRAPLRAMSGFSGVLLQDYAPQLDERARQHLSRISASAERMAQMIDALLSLARLTRTAARREPVDLCALAQAVIAQLRAVEPERAVEFRAQPGLCAQGDPQLLRALLENLLGNAWKFTARRSPAHIEFGSEPSSEGGPVYFVRDDGAGFDMAHVGMLFAPFARLHAAHEFEGTGIGLATAQRIVRCHGGRIWAQGAAQAGATFRFTLSGAAAPPGEAAR